MALTKDQKQQAIAQAEEMLANSKMTVVAKYQGTSVKAIQTLRQQAANDGTQIKVIKNRLFKKAMESFDNLKSLPTDDLSGQLLYAFNAADEVLPAQNLAAFAASNPQLEFVCAFTADGQLLSSDEVKTLANLPSKDQLRAQLAATIAAPISGLANVMAGNLRGLMYVMQARAEQS